MPRRPRRSPAPGQADVPSRAHHPQKLPDPSPNSVDLSDPEQGPPEEPGVSIEAEERGTQFLRDAPEQDNFESERRTESDHDPLGAPVGQVVSDASLDAAEQTERSVPVSGALNDAQPEVLGEPQEQNVDLTSDSISAGSLFDQPVPEGTLSAEQVEQEAEDDPSLAYAPALRAPEIASDDTDDVSEDRREEIQRQLDQRVKQRLHTDTLPSERKQQVASKVKSPTPRSKSPTPRRTRHAARALQTSRAAANVVRDMTGLDDDATALDALEIVAGGIVRRITPGEANDFASQLPSEVQEALLDLPAGPDTNVTLDTISTELAARFDLEPEPAAKLVRDVGMALRQLLSQGELNDIRSQLPNSMRDILPDSVPHPTP